jgi:hypothetical protein
MINYTIINSALNAVIPTPMNKEILYTIHNAGFFSNSTIRLMDIVRYFNTKKRLPDEVDSSVQWLHYKSYPGDRLDTFYFTEQEGTINYESEIDSPYITTDCMAIQFHPYHNIKFEQLKPFVDKYFTPSDTVTSVLRLYEIKYNLDYNNLCAVFYRGNSKFREMKIASYDYFIDKAKEVKAQHPNMKFLVQPDEKEFLEAFQQAFPIDTIYFTETPMINKQDSDNFFELSLDKRKEQGTNFFAALLAISKCHTVITHSGNCGLWTALYRGNSNNLHQIFNNEWLYR